MAYTIVKQVLPNSKETFIFDYSIELRKIYSGSINPDLYKPLLKTYIPTLFKQLILNLQENKKSIDKEYIHEQLNYYIKEINAHLYTVAFKSEKYRTKLLAEMSTLKKDKLFVFLESERYNSFLEHEHNPFLEIIRIRNGLLTHNIISHNFASVCPSTIDGFLNAIKSKTLRVVKFKEADKIITLFAKTKTGTKFGVNKLAINPETLDIFKIRSSIHGDIVYEVEFADNLGIMTPNRKLGDKFKKELKKYLHEVYSKENLHKTKLEMKEFIKKNKELFKRKPIKRKVL